MAKRRELKCEICGAAFVYRGVGQPAKRCLKHRHNRNRDLRVAQEALSGGLPTAPLEAAGVETDGGSKRSLESTARAWRARRLAVGLGLEADPRRAAELVGLEPQSAEELAELVEEAGRYDDLRDRKPQAQAALLQAAITLGAIRLAAGIDTVPQSLLAPNLKALTSALQSVQGHTGVAYSHLQLVVEGPNGELWDPVKRMTIDRAPSSPSSPTPTTTGTSGDPSRGNA